MVTDFIPCLDGSESTLREAQASRPPVQVPAHAEKAQSAFAIALHMHQPMIPAGAGDLQHAAIISNLQHMLDHPEMKDAHNATSFIECYRRMSEFVPQLISEGKTPRVMLDYSGCLLHGLQLMGRDDVIDSLRTLTDQYPTNVEWLGTAWGHAVAPSTPPQDFRRHVIAWQHQFAEMFGSNAFAQVRGFSPPEMALPNHPEVFYEFVKTLLDCGFEWMLVQEHTVEDASDGSAIQHPHFPHRLIARNSAGEQLSITAIIKTQGSDTKLIGQMQPFYEAKNLRRQMLGGVQVPPLVTQISDGENGGVMMNEFPSAYFRAVAESSGSTTPALNVSEYLAYLKKIGADESSFATIQPKGQHRIWQRMGDRRGSEDLQELIQALHQEDSQFSMDGGSWTANLSWVRGYEGLLTPMTQVSRRFAETVGASDCATAADREALYLLLLSQTSCFRYWGEGEWTDYGRELCRRAIAVLPKDGSKG
jgi:hypothetical protein